MCFQVFRLPVSPSAWKVFEVHSPRIIKLDISVGAAGHRLSPKLLAEVALSQPNSTVFPKLESLKGRLGDLSTVYLSKGLKNLHILVESLSTDLEEDLYPDATAKILIQRIHEFCPSLRSLIIEKSKQSSYWTAKESIYLMKGLPQLKSVGLFCQLASKSLLEMLSALENVHSIMLRYRRIGIMLIDVPLDDPDMRVDGVVLLPGAFSNLVAHDICVSSSQDAIDILTTPNYPAWQLRSLGIRLLYGAQHFDNNLFLLLNTIANVCGVLEHLSIQYVECAFDFTYRRSSHGLAAVTVGDISPIGRMKLVSFILDHPTLPRLQINQMKQLLQNCGSLESIALCPCPVWDGDGEFFSFEGLDILATCLPNLRHLAVCFNACSFLEGCRTDPRILFKKLAQLFVGESPVLGQLGNSDPHIFWADLAGALSNALPRGCALLTTEDCNQGATYNGGARGYVWGHNSSRMTNYGWSSVQSMLNALKLERDDRDARLQAIRDNIGMLKRESSGF